MTLEQSVFLKACRREKTPYTPVWLMRQAGRYMKEYRRIRDKVPFLDICRNPDLACEIAVTARQKINADAAILFSDILLIVGCFGLELAYLKQDGPSVQRVQSANGVKKLRKPEPLRKLNYVFEAVRATRRALPASVPLIGFAGAPFTVASYMIEGGASRDFSRTKAFMRSEPAAWALLLKKISRATVEYLNGQIKAGADAVQLFDSWVGCLSETEYKKQVLGHSLYVFKNLKTGVPAIHFGTGTARFLEAFAAAGGDVISVDHRMGLGEAWERIGPEKAIQGNLDPAALSEPVASIRKKVRKILDEAGSRPGHIFNLGHGVLPETPVENVIALVEMVHELSRGGPRVRPDK